MNLAALAARRLILRRGFGLLAGLAVTNGATGVGNGVPLGGFGGRRSAAGLGDEADEEARRVASQPMNDKLRAARRRDEHRREAWHRQDMDLVTLGSTSRAWRASVMMDRIGARDSWQEKLQERVNAIWEAPMDKLSALLRSWVDG